MLLAKYPDFDFSRPDNYFFDTGPVYKCASSVDASRAATTGCDSLAAMEAEVRLVLEPTISFCLADLRKSSTVSL